MFVIKTSQFRFVKTKMENPIAVLRVFTASWCGYCKQIKGEVADASGKIKINADAVWPRLNADKELEDAGIELDVYQTGEVKDPVTGKTKVYNFEPEYIQRIGGGKPFGVPYLELFVPGQPHNAVGFPTRLIKGWTGEDNANAVKKWVLETVQQEPFKSYAAAVRSGKTPASAPSKVEGVTRPIPIGNEPARHGEAYPIKGKDMIPSQVNRVSPKPSQQDLLNKFSTTKREETGRAEPKRVAPSTFGMGTRVVQPIQTPSVAPIKVNEKPKPRFMPANYGK